MKFECRKETHKQADNEERKQVCCFLWWCSSNSSSNATSSLSVRVYKQRSESGIDGRENCEVNAEAQGGFISGRGRGGKVSSGQNRRRRKGEWGMVHWGAEVCRWKDSGAKRGSEWQRENYDERCDWTHQQAPPYVHKPTTTAMSPILTSPSPYFHSPSSSSFFPHSSFLPFLSFPFFPSNLLPTTGLPILPRFSLPRCPARPLCVM